MKNYKIVEKPFFCYYLYALERKLKIVPFCLYITYKAKTKHKKRKIPHIEKKKIKEEKNPTFFKKSEEGKKREEKKVVLK